MAYEGPHPLPISSGGTSTNSFSTTNGIVTYNGTHFVTSPSYQINSNNQWTNTLQPAFTAYANANISNVTGDGTVYTVIFNTALFDNASNFNTSTSQFTAPVAGKYLLKVYVTLSNVLVANTGGSLLIVTTSHTYAPAYSFNPGVTKKSTGDLTVGGTVIALMSANDTASVSVEVSGSTKTVGISGSATLTTFFCGQLIC